MIEELMDYKGKVTVDFDGDGVDYHDYTVTVKSKTHVHIYHNLDRSDLESLIEGTETFLRHLKEAIRE